MTAERRRLGDLGEEIAARHLAESGYRVLDRNFRTRLGELDLVAATADALVFCEVKTLVSPRLPAVAPLEAVGPSKRRRLRLMAREWLARRAGQLGERRPGLRFDAIGVVVGRDGELVALDHVRDAF